MTALVGKVIVLLAGVLPLGTAMEKRGAATLIADSILMGVTYAASLSFVTPIRYQSNTLVYGPGRYRFTDYTRVGLLLNVLFLGVGTALIPLVFPF